MRCWFPLPIAAIPMFAALREGESALVMGTAMFSAVHKKDKFIGGEGDEMVEKM